MYFDNVNVVVGKVKLPCQRNLFLNHSYSHQPGSAPHSRPRAAQADRSLASVGFRRSQRHCQRLHLSLERCLALGDGEQSGGGWGVYDEVKSCNVVVIVMQEVDAGIVKEGQSQL